MTGRRGVLGLIPARGGSKGVPNKNIRLLHGKPLIAYTVESALRSRRLDEVVLSTDSQEIARVAESYGAGVVMRPGDIARDDSPVSAAALHALDVLRERGRHFDCVALLQPTCPLRTEADIDGAVGMLLESDADAVVTVYRVEDQHPARMYSLDGNRLVPYDHRLEAVQHRQQLPVLYHRNGAVYAIVAEALRRSGTFAPSNKLAYVMPRIRSVNIDEEADLMLAEFLLSRQVSAV